MCTSKKQSNCQYCWQNDNENKKEQYVQCLLLYENCYENKDLSLHLMTISLAYQSIYFILDLLLLKAAGHSPRQRHDMLPELSSLQMLQSASTSQIQKQNRHQTVVKFCLVSTKTSLIIIHRELNRSKLAELLHSEEMRYQANMDSQVNSSCQSF